MSGVQELLRHLRANPGDRDAAALSVRFDLDTKLVEMAVQSLPKTATTKPERTNFVKPALAAVSNFWAKLTSNIVPFLIVTSAIAYALFQASDTARGVIRNAGGFHIKVSGILALCAMVLVPLVQFIVLAKCDRYRFAVLGAVFFGTAIGLATNSVAIVIGIALMYLILASPVVVGGSYVRMRREGRATENLSRQELLERLLTVRSALNDAGQAAVLEKGRSRRVQEYLERNVVWIAIVFSLAQSAVSSLLMVSVDPNRALLSVGSSTTKLPAQLSTGLLIAIGFVSVSSYLAQFLFGFLASRIGRSVAVMTGFIGSYLLHFLAPWSYMSISRLAKLGYSNLIAGSMAIAVLILIGTLTRQLYDYAAVKAKRRANDPDALMAEMIELEWRLTPKSSRVTVLAVDVAGSTAMKRNADPMVTEWSFREYQKWIERVCASYGGKVESTAGDGAIVGFVDPQQAVNAAIAVQSDIGEFNRTVNRMAEPFQLRIGLHSGEVQGELGDVQFTRVIDVAAHIESKAPIGGIAVSETLTESLSGTIFQKAAVTTDGHDVYFLTDPLVPPKAELG